MNEILSLIFGIFGLIFFIKGIRLLTKAKYLDLKTTLFSTNILVYDYEYIFVFISLSFMFIIVAIAAVS